MDSETMQKIMDRKDELWSFMQKVQPLPGLLDKLEISGTRDQLRELETILTVIKEMD